MAIAGEEKESGHERITRYKRHFYSHLANHLLDFISLIFDKRFLWFLCWIFQR